MNIAISRVTGGYSQLLAPFARYDIEYSGQVDKVNRPIEFIRNYPDYIDAHLFGGHADVHPPGAILFLWLIEKWFGNGLFQMCAGAIVLSATAVIPVYFLALRLYGRRVATLCAGLFVVTPNIVLFGATCMDGVFALLPICSLWMFSEAIAEDRSATFTFLYSILMGLSLALGFFMTFATVCVGIFAVAYNLLVITRGRRVFLLVLSVNIAALSVVVMVYALLYSTGSFDIIDCLYAAIKVNHLNMGTGRETFGTWLDVSISNLAAFAIDVGIVAVALWSMELWDSVKKGLRLDLFVSSSFVSLVGIGFSSLFHFEVERIWLFLVPLITVPAAVALSRIEHRFRWWCIVLVLSLIFAQTFATQLMLYTYW